jgi:hypothetical protein
MGFIASIFAYLCAVTALVIALSISFDAFLYPPGQTAVGQQIMAAMKSSVSQSTSMPTASNAHPVSPAVTEAAANDSHAGLQNKISQRSRVRRVVRRYRARDWAVQQEPKALGYAEDPAASFLYDRFK